MKTVYLLRHAKAERVGPAAADSERALEERGRGAAALVGRAMAARGWLPDLALVSSARRARQTFEIMAPDLGPRVAVRFESGLYLVEAEILIRRLRRLDDKVDAVLLVGHNPGLQEAALVLAATADPAVARQMAESFPTGALARFCFAVGAWREIGPNSVDAVELLTPKMLRKQDGRGDSPPDQTII